MTDNADLIAEAQTHVTDEYITPDTSAEESLIRRLAAALQAAERRAEDAERQRAKVEAHNVMLLRNGRQVLDQRNQFAAVIEQAEDYVTRHYLDTRFGDEVLPILATAPADALREHDAALIEGLADEIWHKHHAEFIRQMLLGKARQRREEQS